MNSAPSVPKHSAFFFLFSVLSVAALAQIEVVSSGNVGIGTTNPNGVLHVVTPVNSDTGQPRFLSGGSTANEWNEILLGAGVATYKAAMFRYFNGEGTASSAFLNITHYGDTVGISLKGGGNVGVGMTNPGRRLSVESPNTTHTEIAGFLAPDMGSGNVTYALIGRAAASGESGIWGHEYQGTTANSFTWIANYGDNHATGGIAIKKGGNVGIGTTTPGYKLEVAGSVRATSFISNTTTYADFVFKPGYDLPALSEVEAHIAEHGHLPGIPSEAEARAHGIDLAAMQVKLLQKIEELTLHQIAQAKDIAALKAENTRLQRQLTSLSLHP